MHITDSIIINKDLKLVWDILSNINNWGRWNPSIDHAVIYGQLKKGTSFRCNSGICEFDCEILGIESEQKILFKGKTIGLTLILAWLLELGSSGTKVIVSLDASGLMARIFGKRLANYFEFMLHRWLTSLKAQAERGAAVVDDNNADDESPDRQGAVFTTPFSFLSDLKKSREKKRGRLKQISAMSQVDTPIRATA